MITSDQQPVGVFPQKVFDAGESDADAATTFNVCIPRFGLCQLSDDSPGTPIGGDKDAAYSADGGGVVDSEVKGVVSEAVLPAV